MTESPKNILGIDPGSRLCGWGIIQRSGSRLLHIDNGVFVLHSRGDLSRRLGFLLDEIERVLDGYQPDVVAVEGVFQHRNARSALVLGHARGVALGACARRGLDVAEYSATQVKKSVAGNGRASKQQMQDMITMRMGLKDAPQEDAADAVAVAMCHAQHLIRGINPMLHPPKKSKKNARAALAALVREQERRRR